MANEDFWHPWSTFLAHGDCPTPGCQARLQVHSTVSPVAREVVRVTCADCGALIWEKPHGDYCDSD